MSEGSAPTWLAAAAVAVLTAVLLSSRLFFPEPLLPVVSDGALLVLVAASAAAVLTLKVGLKSRPPPSTEEGSDPSGGGGGSADGGRMGSTSNLSRRRGAVNVPESVREGSSVLDEIDPSTSGGGGADGFPVVGAGFDQLVSVGLDYDVEPRQRLEARREVVEELRATAVLAYSRVFGADAGAAEEAVSTGEWTGDHRAAALLSDDDGPGVPLKHRLFDLLAGRDPFESAVDHAVDEITTLDSVAEDGGGGLKMEVDG